AQGEEQEAERPLFRDEVSGAPGGDGVSSVDPAGAGRIGFGAPSASSTGGGFTPEGSSMPVCTRCGHRNAEASKFCSNCGAPLRGGIPERPSETTSTISISGLEAYEAEA
ncbi:zinc ribbon domain-containing protein, partial [Streptomyces sp. SID7982]|nr:zinc ribbon domain-containing protein [Streptomyces sp. SID7982]